MDKEQKLKELIDLLNTAWKIPRYKVTVDLGILIPELDSLLEYAMDMNEEIMVYYDEGAILYLSLVKNYQKHFDSIKKNIILH
jgi:hypothetical protein